MPNWLKKTFGKQQHQSNSNTPPQLSIENDPANILDTAAVSEQEIQPEEGQRPVEIREHENNPNNNNSSYMLMQRTTTGTDLNREQYCGVNNEKTLFRIAGSLWSGNSKQRSFYRPNTLSMGRINADELLRCQQQQQLQQQEGVQQSRLQLQLQQQLHQQELRLQQFQQVLQQDQQPSPLASPALITTTTTAQQKHRASLFNSMKRKILKVFSIPSSEQHDEITNDYRMLQRLRNENPAINNVTENDENQQCYLYVPFTQDEITMIIAKGQMKEFGWFWGNISRVRAQKELHGKPNGSFLVRDSQTIGTHFTMSFRSVGITLHYRIEYLNEWWTIESVRYPTIVSLIEDAMKKSENNIYCYVKPYSLVEPPFPVQLIYPVSRFSTVNSLKNICRELITKLIVDTNNIDNLELPKSLQEYLKET